MKLIIDIPEETYQIIRDTQHLGDSGEATLENVLIRAVEDGEKYKTGHWIKKLRHYNAQDTYTGEDVVTGEERTIRMLKRFDYYEDYCSECGSICSEVSLKYCSVCGTQMEGEVSE